MRHRRGTGSHRVDQPLPLTDVVPSSIKPDAARIAFWINVYNALLLRIVSERPFRRNVLLGFRTFGAYAFEIGGCPFTLNMIEHGILRGNRRPPAGLRAPLRPGDPRLAALPANPDPRIHFALNCGARSCPPIRVFDADSAAAMLESATRAYLQAETRIDAGARRVELPGLMRLYRSDFGDEGAQLDFAASRLPELRNLLVAEARPRVTYARFDWRVATAGGGEDNVSATGNSQ